MFYKKWLIVFLTTSIFILPIIFCIEFMPYHNLKLLALNSNDIVYFSDSVMKSHSKCEKNPMGVDDILREMGLHVINLNSSAYSPILYKDYIKIIPKNTTVVVPINLRSFSEEWFYFNQYRFTAQRIIYSILALDLKAAYQAIYDYFIYTKEKYNSLNIVRDNENLGTANNIQKIKIDEDFYCNDKFYYKKEEFKDKLSLKYKSSYMYKLDRNHDMFKYINEMINYAKNHNIKLIFYITPINIDHGKVIVGDDFKSSVDNNVKIIKQFFIDHNISVLDLSYGVPGENFIDQNYVCEHLDYYGRKIIAKNIIEILLQN
ncbi:hypothetical protein [Campylobacter concisus]|uniref:hypothetical protein n=1 Tax=Campylobacter concisus TaxID=199 RepID=UPI000CD91837|nr:hypothetical protein [Campylobacter concisus]